MCLDLDRRICLDLPVKFPADYSRSMTLILGVAAILLWEMPDLSAQNREVRGWTSNDGRTIQASLLHSDGKTVTLRLADGREAAVPIERLSESDQTYLADMSATGRTIAIGKMPDETKVDQSIEVEGGPRVFNTPHFQFDCDQGVTKGFISEAARVFEGTLHAIDSLPLGINPKPAEGASRFHTLFLSRGAFDQELAKTPLAPATPNGSTSGLIPIPRTTTVAGVYIPSRQEVLVPFSSLGVEKNGSQLTLRRSSDTSTLIHEITHQVMHDWLVVTPVWFSEGLAEYISAVPYQNGRFEFRNAERGLKESLEESFRDQKGNPVQMIHSSDLIQMQSSEWTGSIPEYKSAMLLIYYFMHLDQPEKPGAALAAYLHLLERGKTDTENFVANYNGAVAEFEKKRLAYNKEIDAFNAALLKYREDVVAYNGRIKTYNQQAQAGAPEDQRITVGDEPQPPTPPEKLEVPYILKENQGGGGPIDLSARVAETARPALLRDRELAEIADQIVKAYDEIGITIDMASPRGPRTNARPFTVREIPIQQ